MELLRYRTRYHSQQQELAVRKEKHLLRNDLVGGLLMLKNGNTISRWFIGITHKPHDIMCGDAYIVRQLESGDLLLFLVDAMGSGLSASLTAVSATSCVNFLIDLYEREERFDFNRLVDCFIAHCRTILLDDEVISSGFIHFDVSSDSCNAALFGLPPFVVTSADGAVATVRGKNPPVTNITENRQRQSIFINSCNGLIIHTDGLSDAETADGVLFSERLFTDVEETFTANELFERFKKNVKNREDDMTFIRLGRIPVCEPFFRHFIQDPSCSDISIAVNNFEKSLLQFYDLGSGWIESILLALNETMINALEHGCLGMGGAKKQQLIANEEYDAALSQKAYSSHILLTAEHHIIGKRAAIILFVEDSGSGFNLKEVLSQKATKNDFQGRGRIVIASMIDQLTYNYNGNTACLLKYLP